MEIPKEVLDEIRRQLEGGYPNEVCGLLLGLQIDNGRAQVHRAFAAGNLRRSDGAARKRYLIAPEEYSMVEREADAAGLAVVGAYHSHPDAPAQPSAYDLEHAWPSLSYLIVSVVSGATRDTRVWRLLDDRSGFVEHPLVVQETEIVKETRK